MSNRASAYAKTLQVCPNGEMISPREKLVLIVLADSHQDKAKHFTYPSIDTIAEDAMCDRRSCQRYLAALDRKGVIVRLRPPSQGRGMQVFYFFAAFDEIPEGWQAAALFDAPNLQRKGGKRAAEGRQKGDRRAANGQLALVERAQERELQQEQEQETTPQPPQAGADGDACDADVEFTAEQTANMEANPHSRELYERFYREENRQRRADELEAARKLHERAVEIGRLKVAMPTVEAAMEWVMRHMRQVIKPGRRRGVAQAVFLAITQSGREPWEAGERMAAAWERWKFNLHNMRLKYGPLKFIELGFWDDDRLWPWDEEQLRKAGAASVGTR